MEKWTKPQIALMLLIPLLMIGLPVIFGIWMVLPASVPSGLVSPEQVSTVPTPALVDPAASAQSQFVSSTDPSLSKIPGAWAAKGVKTVAAASLSGQAAPMLQFRLVVAPDESADVDVMVDPSNGQPVRVLNEIEIDESDVVRVYPEQVDGRTEIGLNFSPEGSAKLARLTAANINRRLAVVINGALVSAPMIRTQISGVGVIDGGGPNGFTPQQAQAIIDSINARIGKKER